jgi:diguanylate cyclase (GGDEF)-like protein
MHFDNIVVMDPDPKNLARIARALRPYGHGILWAENLEDGLNLLAEVNPPLLLASGELPGLDEPAELVETVESLNLSTQIVILAQEPEFDRAMDWVSHGVFSVLTLPINPERLRQVVGRIVESRKIIRYAAKSVCPEEREKSLVLYQNLAGHLESGPLMTSLAETARTLTGASRTEAWAGDDFINQQKHFSGVDNLPTNYEVTLEMPWLGQSLASLKLCFANQKAMEGLDPLVLHELQCVGSLFLNHARNYENAVRMASRDPLTGLFNRRIFLEHLDREFYQSRRHDSPLSMVMLDLDHFKDVNDTYGHQTGDQILKWLAETIGAVTRAGDLPARIGGEEFAIILPRTTLEQALVLAQRLKDALTASDLPQGLVADKPTVSQGVADINHFLIKSPADLVYWSDQAMYLAKRSGRDTVKTLSELPGQRNIEDSRYVFQ